MHNLWSKQKYIIKIFNYLTEKMLNIWNTLFKSSLIIFIFQKGREEKELNFLYHLLNRIVEIHNKNFQLLNRENAQYLKYTSSNLA